MLISTLSKKIQRHNLNSDGKQPLKLRLLQCYLLNCLWVNTGVGAGTKRG